MRASIALAVALAGMAWTEAATADDLFDTAAVSPSELNVNSNNVQLGNATTNTQTNSDSPITLGENAIKYSGSISEATVTGNQGITAVMQNTGDLVNMSNATSVNVYLQ